MFVGPTHSNDCSLGFDCFDNGVVVDDRCHDESLDGERADNFTPDLVSGEQASWGEGVEIWVWL